MAVAHRECFVISPFTPESTELLDAVIRPALKPLGYVVFRGDEVSTPGSIPDQIQKTLQDVDLVVADLTTPNQNVVYELGFRDAIRKPAILIVGPQTTIPFNLNHLRRIVVDRLRSSWTRTAINDVSRAAQAAMNERGFQDLVLDLTAEAKEAATSPVRRSLIELAPEVDASAEALSPAALENLLVLLERLAKGHLTGVPVDGGAEWVATAGSPAVSAYYTVNGDRITIRRVGEAPTD
ncbi:MAG TPA: hypothetical protein VKB93_04770 [Thermoanaerobaculia bacterium]|nr:hypothetical protein [Thermoanaerobaculia bacterium]